MDLRPGVSLIRATYIRLLISKKYFLLTNNRNDVEIEEFSIHSLIYGINGKRRNYNKKVML